MVVVWFDCNFIDVSLWSIFLALTLTLVLRLALILGLWLSLSLVGLLLQFRLVRIFDTLSWWALFLQRFLRTLLLEGPLRTLCDE